MGISNPAAFELDEGRIPKKPNISNLSSPNEAMETPMTMSETFRRTFMLGAAMPKAQVATRVATAFVACLSRSVTGAQLSES